MATPKRRRHKTIAAYPELVLEWHPTKNAGLRPMDVRAGSGRKIWWVCRYDGSHHWLAQAKSRAALGTGCPFCAGKRLTKQASFAAVFPRLAREWHPTKNGALTPREVSFGSTEPVWWQCSRQSDHEWLASPGKRRGCPFCAGKRAAPSTCLAVLAPEIAREWHPTKNGTLTPHDVTVASSRTVWWQCVEGADHQWQALIKNRTLGGTGCPFCSRTRVSKATSLSAVAPWVAQQWHPTKNGTLTPSDIMPFSNRQVWWACPAHPDHAWQATPNARVRLGTACPFCTGQRVTRQSSLAAISPRIARQWHPSKNQGLEPSDVTPGSNLDIWWKCPRGPDHEWQATPAHRARTGCPFCAGRRVSQSNSLAALRPDLARRWHPTNNRALTPRDVSPGSTRRVWWKCPHGPDHEWEAQVGNAAALVSGCPFCTGKRVSVTNSLATLRPALAAEWHPTKNRLRPTEVTAGSNRKIWWKCPRGPRHEWRAAPASRVRSGCPFCAGKRRPR